MFRKHLIFFFSLLLAFSLGFMVQAEATDDIMVMLDGQLLSIDSGAPEIVDGRTFVPLRALSEAMSLIVDFDSETSTVSVGDIFTHVIGDTFVTMNDDEIVDIGVASYIKEERTMVSMRLFGEALGASVAWDGELRQVTLESNPAETNPDDSTPTEATLPEMKRVENPRFGFSLEIPTTWEAGDVSENGDGFMVFAGNLDIDIRAWGSYDVTVMGLEEILARYEESETMQTIDEETLYIVPLENGVEFVLLTDEKSVHFSVDHAGISEWLEENSAIVEHMAFSLTLFETEPIGDFDMPIPGPFSPVAAFFYDDELLETYSLLTEDILVLDAEEDGATLVLLGFDDAVTEFQITQMEFVDDAEEFLLEEVEVLYGPEDIDTGVALVLSAIIPEGAPRHRLTFTDSMENQMSYLLTISGLTGEIFLTPYYPDAE